MHDPLNALFSADYAQAREKFHAAADALLLPVQSERLDTHLGACREALAMDHVLISPPEAHSLLIITSGTHGVEGFAGSACQIGLLKDKQLLAAAGTNQVAVLLIHAVNPYGFSHLRRVNEDNVDLNRNCIDFAAVRPVNAGYAGIHDLLLPEIWPPDDQNKRDIARYYKQHGEETFRRALLSGQYQIPDGMFYGGTGPTWSHRTLRALFQRHLKAFKHIGLIDVHTGLGAHGHGEKIFIGVPVGDEMARAKAFWGSDVMVPASVGAASIPVSGPISTLLYAEAQHDAQVTSMALEYGTLLSDEVRSSLRGDHWLHKQKMVIAGQAYAIKRAIREAHFCDVDSWKGRVYGQFKTCALQALRGLGESSHM